MTVVFSDNGAQIIEKAISRLYPITVRADVTDNDANEAAVYAIDSGADCLECDVIEVEIDMTGSTAGDTFDITPLVKAEGAAVYSRLIDQKKTLAFSDATVRKFRLTVGGNSDVNFLCNNKAGSSPTIASIKVIPVRGIGGLPLYDDSLVLYKGHVSGSIIRSIDSRMADLALSAKDFPGVVGDGVNDDTVGLQAALTAAAGHMLYIPAGTYKLTNDLTMSDDTILTGDGTATIFSFVCSGGAGNRRVLMGNRCEIYNIKITETSITGTRGVYGVIHIASKTDISIHDVLIDTVAGVGILGTYAGRVSIFNCRVTGTHADGIFFQRGSYELSIFNNRVWNTGDNCIAVVSHAYSATDPNNTNFFDVCRNVTIFSNFVADTNDDLNPQSKGIALVGLVDGIVTNNHVRNTGGAGIQLSSYVGSDNANTIFASTKDCAPLGRIRISSNILYNTGIGTDSTDTYGIYLSTGRDIDITHNTITNATGPGIFGSGAFYGLNISNNKIVNAGSNGMYIAPTKYTYATDTHKTYFQIFLHALLNDGGATPETVCGDNIIINNNIIDRCGAYGIFCNGQAVTPFTNLSINYNRILRANADNGTAYGIWSNFADMLDVNGNAVLYPENALSAPIGIANNTNSSLISLTYV